MPLRHDTPRCHACDIPPTHLWLRQATAEEAAAIRSEIRRYRRIELHLDGELSDEDLDRYYGAPRVPVAGCADHNLAPAPDSDDQGAIETATQAGTERRALLHAAECGGHDNCACEPS
jgi:hypothetical protein